MWCYGETYPKSYFLICTLVYSVYYISIKDDHSIPFLLLKKSDQARKSTYLDICQGCIPPYQRQSFWGKTFFPLAFHNMDPVESGLFQDWAFFQCWAPLNPPAKLNFFNKFRSFQAITTYLQGSCRLTQSRQKMFNIDQQTSLGYLAQVPYLDLCNRRGGKSGTASVAMKTSQRCECFLILRRKKNDCEGQRQYIGPCASMEKMLLKYFANPGTESLTSFVKREI